jgi:hypothetical protein
MRVAKFSVLLAVMLFGAGALSILGSWAVTASCLVMLGGAVAGAIAMEERDLESVAGLAASSSDEAEPALSDVGLTRAA